MGFNDIYQRAVEQSLKTDYSKTDADTVSIFETNIRHVGGLLSSYELGGKKEPRLIDQAKVVVDKLMYGWINGNDLPYNTLGYWNSLPTPQDTKDGAIIAETGTLIIEFDRLSKYTGNNTYRDFAAKAMKATIDAPGLPFPGLNPQGIDPKTGKPIDDYVTWGGGSDSFFEYQIKYAQLVGSQQVYLPAWVKAVTSSIQHLLTKASGTSKDLTYLGDYSKQRGGLLPRGSHLECFVGGNWMLGGTLLGDNQIFQFGLDLTRSCINTYLSGATGIGPEGFRYASLQSDKVNITDQAFYQKNGFDYTSKPYVLRPEVVESVFYAYRLTGDKYWQQVAWKAFNALEKYCSTDTAWTSLEDVSNPNTKQIDDSESFLYAELYKYLYLTFDSSKIDLGKYVFNTEAHPFEIDDPSVTFADLKPDSVGDPASITADQRKGEGFSPSSPAQDPQTSGASKAKSAPASYFSHNPISNKAAGDLMSLVGRGLRKQRPLVGAKKMQSGHDTAAGGAVADKMKQTQWKADA